MKPDGTIRPSRRIRGQLAQRWRDREYNVLVGLKDHDLPDVFRTVNGFGREGYSWMTSKNKTRRRVDHIMVKAFRKIT